MRPDYDKKVVVVSSALTGDIVDCIKMSRLCKETVADHVRDLFYYDMINNEEGLLIKFGIDP